MGAPIASQPLLAIAIHTLPTRVWPSPVLCDSIARHRSIDLHYTLQAIAYPSHTYFGITVPMQITLRANAPVERGVSWRDGGALSGSAGSMGGGIVVAPPATPNPKS